MKVVGETAWVGTAKINPYSDVYTFTVTGYSLKDAADTLTEVVAQKALSKPVAANKVTLLSITKVEPVFTLFR